MTGLKHFRLWPMDMHADFVLFSFCFSLHRILFHLKFCMNIDTCIIYPSVFFAELSMHILMWSFVLGAQENLRHWGALTGYACSRGWYRTKFEQCMLLWSLVQLYLIWGMHISKPMKLQYVLYSGVQHQDSSDRLVVVQAEQSKLEPSSACTLRSEVSALI